MQQLSVVFYWFHTLNTQFLCESGNVKAVSVVKTRILAYNYCSLNDFLFLREVLSLLLSALSETCILLSSFVC